LNTGQLSEASIVYNLAKEKFAESVKLLRQARDMGHPEALYCLARLTNRGLGVEQNDELGP